MVTDYINDELEEFVVGDLPGKSLEEKILQTSLSDWTPLLGLGRTIEFTEKVGKHKYKPTLPETLYYGINYLYHTPALGVVALISIFFELYSAYETVKLRLESKGIPPFP